MKKLLVLVVSLFLVAQVVIAKQHEKSAMKPSMKEGTETTKEACMQNKGQWEEMWNADKTKKDWKCMHEEKATETK